MTTAKDESQTTPTADRVSTTAHGARGERRKYVTPELRCLGSVRELTLGTSNKALEGGQRNM